MKNKQTHINPQTAFAKAAALCSRCEYAAADISSRLLKWGLEPLQVTDVLKRLTDEGFLNEQRFAHAFVNDKFKFNGWGRLKIAHQLQAKGIDRAIIDEALTRIDEAEYRETLQRLLQARAQSTCNKEPQQARAALLRFAASRGFEPQEFFPAVDHILNDMGYEQD
jgi:regulatory protein